MKSKAGHAYLKGNYAPVKAELRLTSCHILHGSVPDEFSGGQYVRNGGNPMSDEDQERNAHWFDGDGMLTGVLFKRGEGPHFINRYILTDVLLATSPALQRPFLPSISTFAMPFSLLSLFGLLANLMRTMLLALLSWLPFQPYLGLRRISVANTSVWWHDGQAFAGCESGPPIRILLPGLETADWWDGGWSSKGWGPSRMLSEFTTAHPRIDPVTNELLLYHMSFSAPYLRITVVPPRSSSKPALLGAPVPGLDRPKLAHDFCATPRHTILIDLPMLLDPRNLLEAKPMLEYQTGSKAKTRFGILPRWSPEEVQWYESEACCIYHAANAWDDDGGESTSLIACRLNSATLVYSAGNMDTPSHARAQDGTERCQLYYWQFSLLHNAVIKTEFPLSDIPLEFPTMNGAYSQRANRFIYGASMTSGTFDAGLGRQSAKIDCLAKVNVARLIEKGLQRGVKGAREAVDTRTVGQILQSKRSSSGGKDGGDDDIQIFALPPHHYAQEATFVSRSHATEEDDGYLTFFVFDEANGLDRDGNCVPDAASQLWILDAKTMSDVVCKIQLPQRVPYGLHGHFFSEDDICSQQPQSDEHIRSWALSRSGAKESKEQKRSHLASIVSSLRAAVEAHLA